jgi:hypothetical protein
MGRAQKEFGAERQCPHMPDIDTERTLAALA